MSQEKIVKDFDMGKDFDSWNRLKKTLDRGKGRFYHEREIWWCALGLNIGFEQDGTGKNYDRPILILKAVSANIFLGIALTSKSKQNKFHLPIGNINGQSASVILSQIRLIDKKRLIRRIEIIDKDTFAVVKNSVQQLFFR